MNKSYKSLWNESLGAWVATSEITSARGKRSASARTVLASAALALAGLHAPAWADTAIGTSTTINLEGAICTAVGTPAAGTNSWTCQVPNTFGGFATITGIATNATGTGPDIPALSALVATNLGTNAILIGGTSAKATGNNSIAIAGQAEGLDSIAIGRGASAFGNYSVALGESAIAGKSGTPSVASSIAIGELAKAPGDNAIAMGRNTFAGGDQSISIGIQAGLGSTNTLYATFVGASAGTLSTGRANTAIGFGAGQKVIGEVNTAVGATAGQSVEGDANVAVGRRAGQNIGAAGTPVNNTVAIGFESKATVSGGVALGSNALASTVAGAVGYLPASATPAQALAIVATQSTLAAVSVGDVATGKFRQINGVAAGTVDSDAVNVSQLKAVSSAAAASATHYYSVNDGGVLGGNYVNDGATANNTVAIGPNAVASGNNSLAVGNGAKASKQNAIAIGNSASADGVGGVGAVAIGGGDPSFGGSRDNTAGKGSVAVGFGSQANSAVGDKQGASAFGAFAQANKGSYNTALGYKASANADAIQADGYAGALASGAFANASGSASTALGSTAKASATTATAVGNGANASVAGGVALGSDSVASTALGAVGYVPTSASVAQSAAIALTTGTLGAVSVGNVASNQYRQINGVAAGTVDSDAVNVSQLKAVGVAAAAGAVHYFGVNSTGGGNYNNEGATGADAIAIGKGATAGNDNSVAMGNNSTTRAATVETTATVTYPAVVGPPATPAGNFTYGGFAGNANVMGAFSVGNAGATRQIINVAPGAISATSTDAINGSQLYSVAKGINERIDTIPAGSGGGTGPAGPAGTNGANGVKGADADTQGAVMYTKNADNSVNYNEIKLNPNGNGNGPTTITHLADGKNPGDAVNLNQLGKEANKWITGNPENYVAPKATGQNATAAGSAAVASGHNATALGYAATASGSNSVALGVNSNDEGRSNVLSVGATGAERQISNVAPGTQGTDVVNLNQLNTGLGSATTQLRNELNGVSKDANAGTAAAIAMANMPQAFTPGKSMIAAGAGYYEGQTAVSIGVSKLSDNGRWVIKFSGSADTRGKVGVGAGAGFQW